MNWTQALMSHWVIERTSMRWWFLGFDGMGMGILLGGKFNSVGLTLQIISMTIGKLNLFNNNIPK